MSAVRIGISGWNYAPFRGVFYPEGLAQKRELAFASRAFDTIEVNGSFYSLLCPETVARWRDEAPPGFVFALKGSRYITHMRRLRDVETALANFFASGALALRDKLGPLLWQLPPSLAFDAATLEGFFHLLPKTTAEASRLARKHDDRLGGRVYLGEEDDDRPMRHTVEVRHPSFGDPAFIALLRRHGIALCVADTAGLFPAFEDVTADFVYARLHGDEKLYESGYSVPALERWAERIAAWKRGGERKAALLASPEPKAPRAKGRDVYVYFDNDARVRSPFDAATLRALVDGAELPAHPEGLAGAGEPARVQWPAWRAAGEAVMRPKRKAAARR